MCGIVFAHDFTGAPVNNGILNVFDKQRSRGTSGFGLFDGQYQHIVKATKEDSILRWLAKYDSDMILFHHREPTSTANTKRTAHPFSTKKHFGNTQYVLVHNGHISNSEELQKAHKKLGISYQSMVHGKFNDSESLLWEMALYLEGKQDDMDAVGGMAFVCVKLVKGKLDKLFFGRNSRPLNIYRDKQGIALSSEGPGDSVDSNQLYTWNYKTKRLTQRSFFMPSYTYPSYTAPVVPRAGTAGDWLPETTRHRYQGWLNTEPDGYAQDHYTKLYLPSGQESGARGMDDEYYENSVEPDWMEELELYEPTLPEIERRVLDFLCRHRGLYEQAYLEAENEYVQIAEDIEVASEYKQARLLERVMEYIDSEPEYVSPTSISSMWQEVWAT